MLWRSSYFDKRLLALGQDYWKVVFVGYCAVVLQYRWPDDHRLPMVCNVEKVMKRIEALKSVHIRYDTITLHSFLDHLRDIILLVHGEKSAERYYYKNDRLRR